MAMKEVKSVDILSVGKIYGLFGVIIGFVIGLIVTAIASLLPAGTSITGLSTMFVGVGIFSIIISPIIYGLISFLVGCICAAIYNFLAERFGGIKIELA